MQPSSNDEETFMVALTSDVAFPISVFYNSIRRKQHFYRHKSIINISQFPVGRKFSASNFLKGGFVKMSFNDISILNKSENLTLVLIGTVGWNLSMSRSMKYISC